MEKGTGNNNKVDNLRRIIQAKGKKALLLERQNNISWLLQGRTHVNLGTANGVVDIVVDEQAVYLVSNNIEAKRLVEEEFPFPVEVREYDWFDGNGRSRVLVELTGGSFITDAECENEIRAFRLIMDAEEREQYISLGRDTAEVVQEACMEVLPGMTEFQAAGMMAAKFLERGIDPLILLVAADERIHSYRHPLPTAKNLEDYIMLVAGGRRYGQIACITRFVAFSPLAEELIRKRDAVLQLEAMLLEETRPGTGTAQLFGKLVEGYGELGYGQEWKLHHQGGLTGYNSREFKASFDVDIAVQEGQVYAWNPSITGFKAEDTMIVEKQGNRILTGTPQLPYTDIKYKGKMVSRPDILVRRIYR